MYPIIQDIEKIQQDDSIAAPLAAIIALTNLVESSSISTMAELLNALEAASTTLVNHIPNSIAVSAGCNLFINFVAQFHDQASDFDHLKAELIRQGRMYAQEARSYREKIANMVLEFIQDDSIILTHSYSRVIIQALVLAHRHKRISVYVTDARPRGLGQKTLEALTALGIPCKLILDSAVAYVMDKIDICLVGSEAVVESGGIINAVGSYQMALIAKTANKPFYALAESYKFHRLFPLSQFDLPSFGNPSAAQGQALSADDSILNPTVDYTKPDLITLVFSDVGILTPDGVSQYLVSMFSG